jgi:phospholipid/cholesterol/gamma-HCH transport system substrate-binding protein
VLNGELLGGRFIQLAVGKPDENILKPKDTIRTDVAKGLTEILSENAEPVAANLQTTMAKLNSILDTLGTSASLLNHIMVDLQTTPGKFHSTMASVQGNVAQLADTFKSVGNKLNVTLTNLQPTLKNFETLSDSLKVIQLNGTINKAQQTLSNLNQTLAKLNKGDNTASKLLTDDSLYVNLNVLLENLDSLANHFNENPRHFMAPLGKSRKKIQRELEDQRDKENKKQ